MIKAFRDTWELGIHSYLTYLRDRLLLAKELLAESGSIFVQISDENVHLVRCLMDEVFGVANSVVTLIVKKKSATLPTHSVNDYLLWYARSKASMSQAHPFFYERSSPEDDSKYNTLISPAHEQKRAKDLSSKEIEALIQKGWQWARVNYPIVSQEYQEQRSKDFLFKGKLFNCGNNRHWSFSEDGLRRLEKAHRLFDGGGASLGGVVFWNDWPYVLRSNIWDDVHGEPNIIYVVQTSYKVVARCILMTTDPGDLVLDITCGSGTTGYVAEQWGRRWITCDTSRIAITLAKQRLMTALFDYYELAQPSEGVGSGFRYKTVPHITLKSIANNEPPARETLYDQPSVDNSRTRVTGPFTVEAVPAPSVKPLDDVKGDGAIADQSLARSGETLRQAEWRDELLKTGIRGKNNQYILFSRVESLAGTRWLHADAETKPNERGAESVREKSSGYGQPERAVISFGPEHAPLDKKQVEQAIQEAQKLVPKPTIVVFAAFEFDAEAAKDIDETGWPGVTLLKAKMNADLLTDDLKKKRASNESFWLIGQPDVSIRAATEKEVARLKLKAESRSLRHYIIEVHGFDYYNTKTGNIESGGTENIALWMLDTDYDGRSLFPRQVFFPMAGEKDGWARIARNLKAEIDEALAEAYRGTVSLPFVPGGHQRVAVKIVDDRGIESLKVLEVG